MSPEVPPARLLPANRAPVRAEGAYVLYWMIAARRTRHNFALQHAVARGRALGRPVLVFEALRCGYRWASQRLHRFVLDGMEDNQAACAAAGVTYHAYVEATLGEGAGLLETLAADACEVITDHFPSFFLPRMVAAAAAKLPVRLTAVDGNGLLPLGLHDREFTVAHSFRRHLQKVCHPHLEAFPAPDPLADAAPLGRATVPAAVAARWPDLRRRPVELARLPIDHRVAPGPDQRGGPRAAEARLADFIARKLPRYHEDRSAPEADGGSGLSAALHFGHLSAHAILEAVWRAEAWTPARLAERATGKREGWWGLSAPAEAFLDELITWRELGYAFSHRRPHDYDRYESLPDWARTTLADHAGDPRPTTYDLETLAAGGTHDPLWNAAQGELVTTGRMHNYLRMLWGKKILEWTPDPNTALETLIELNNRYALDGRNPNSYSGIFWVLGRFDRAWGPERPIFGKIRYMTSDSTARKFPVKAYIARHHPRP